MAKGWLDNYGKQENYNNSKTSVPQGFVGEGYNTKGRNYSPAWGGQFEDGGFIPIAQKGVDVPATRADSIGVYNDAVNSKKYYEKTYSKFYEKPKVRKAFDNYFWNMETIKKDHLKHEDVTPANKQKIRQNKNPNQYLLSDMITGAIDPKAPLFRYDKRIKPQGEVNYTPKNYLHKELEKIDPKLYSYENTQLADAVYGSILGSKMNKREVALYNKWKASHPHDLKKLKDLKKYDDYVGDNTPGYITTLPYYDPIAIKPFNLLTDAEKKIRVKKYGPSGVPKSYLNANKIKLNVDPKPNPNKKLNVDPKIRTQQEVVQPDLPMVEAVNLPPMQQLQSINPPAISDVVREPKSYNVNRKTYNTKGGLIDYYTKNEEGVDYERAMLIKSGADAWNRDILKRYGPQNEYRTPKSAADAAERLKQLRSEFEMTPNYQMGGSVYPVNYVPQAQDGKLTFLQPTSDKLPQGYRIPYADPSSELAMSIGGENGEPAYLIPSFKYGKPLYNAIEEFKKTGEHLGGPFKTWQEADKWEQEVRHPYVEKGQAIPMPIKTWGEMAMGGSIPGAVGFSYARTQSPAPSNGPYAKKTMASAQDGAWLNKYDVAQDGKKAFPKFEKIKVKSEEEKLRELIEEKRRPREMVRDNTRVVFRDEKGKQKTVNPNQQVSTKYNAVKEAKQKKEETKAMLADRKARIEDSILAQDEDIIGNPNWREVLARETQATGDKFRLFPEEDSFIDDWLNPAVMIGNMASDLGGAPLRAQQEDSYMPYITSIGVPLLTGGLEGIGAKTNRQFINNIANPFNIVPGYNSARKYVGNKLGNISTNITPKLGQPILSDANNFANRTKKFLRNNVFTDKTFNRLETIDNVLGKSYRAVNPFHHIQAQKSLDEANQWMDNWYNDPITKEKIKEVSSRFGPPNPDGSKLLENIENKNYRSSFEANTNKVDNFLAGNPRLHKGNYGVSGYYLDAYKDFSKRQNLVSKYINPSDIVSTAIHEGNHGFTDGNRLIKGYEDILQSPFDTRNFKPRLNDGSFEKNSDYLLNPTEINARLSEIRYEHGLKPGENLTLDKIHDIVNKGVLGESKVDAEFYHLINNRNKFKDVMNYVPAAVPIAGGIGIASQMQNEEEVPGMKDGGVIKDDMGQWNHPGEITEIGSNQITMEGVPYDVLGISDEGDTKLMKPGKDYKFKGKKVTEYPMAKNGLRQEQKGLVNLDQLTNFTNYNKPQPGGWLNKYN